jgi:hypothetical protein
VSRQPHEFSQYTSAEFTGALAVVGAVASVGTVGDSYDCETAACRPAA